MFAWFGMRHVKKTDCDLDPADSPSRIERCEVSVCLPDSRSILD